MTEPADTRDQADEARIAATAKAFRARSRRVHLLRRILPVAIIVLAGGTISWIVLRSVMSDVERKAGTSREVTLENSRFLGQDAEGRSFVVGFERAVRDSGGAALAVGDPAILAAVDAAARKDGLLLCPEGGATLAAYRQAVADGLVDEEERVVLFNCATGLKYPMPPVSRTLNRHAPIDYRAL